MTNPSPLIPVYTEVGEYPKVLYRFDGQFTDEDGLKAGLAPGGGVRSKVVPDAQAEADAINDGWTAYPTDFIAVAGEPTPAATRRASKKAAAE